MGACRSAAPVGQADAEGWPTAGRRPGLPGRHRIRVAQRRSLARRAERVPIRADLLAAAHGVDSGGRLGIGLGHRLGGTRRRRRCGHRRVVRRWDLHSGPKRGYEVGKTKVGKGIKIEIVTDANGIPIGVATAAANEPETVLIGPALDAIPDSIDLPDQVPVIADKAYDSDPLRDELAEAGFRLLSPHRKNRRYTRSNDGRRMRRYNRRWIVERTIGWLHSFRRLVVRHEYYSFIFDGFVHLALALITLSKF